MAMGVVEAICKFKYFIFCRQKNTGNMARAQGKHREFGINWSVATLQDMLTLDIGAPIMQKSVAQKELRLLKR